jgi:PKD repeat protein
MEERTLKKKFLIGLVAIFLLIVTLSGCVEEKPKPTPANTAPEASFTEEIDGMTVNFNDASIDADGDDLTYLWDFDDGTTNDSQNPVHTYIENGTYTVTLTVNDGTEENVSTKNIIVGNLGPTAGFDYEIENLTVMFEDTSYDPNGDNLTYLWDFGDGTTNDSQNPVYTYAANGTYNVTLTVTDPYGETDTTEILEITVEEASEE